MYCHLWLRDKNSPTSGRKISRRKIPLAIVLKIDGVVDFPHKLGKSFWMKSSLASQLVATRRQRGCKFAIPLLIVGFEGYGQKCPILVIGRKSALSPKLDRVNLLIFENVQGSWTRSKMYEFNFRSFLRERQMGQREDDISSPLQYQICPPKEQSGSSILSCQTTCVLSPEQWWTNRSLFWIIGTVAFHDALSLKTVDKLPRRFNGSEFSSILSRLQYQFPPGINRG